MSRVTSDAPLKVAVVGAGAMGMNHVRALRDFDEGNIQLVGVADSQVPALAEATRRCHVAGFADYRRMIEETRPDLVAVVVPTSLHFEVASYALEQGIHVLIEKPIASTVDQARTLIRLAETNGAKIAVGYLQRFNPALAALKRHLEEGACQIYSLHARHLGPFPSRIWDVGVTLDMATHDLDFMRYVTGAEIEHASAEVRQQLHPHHEDLLLGLVRFSNGAVGVLDVNWLTPTIVRELSVTCERGMYTVNQMTQELYFYANGASPANAGAAYFYANGSGAESGDGARVQARVSEGIMTRVKVPKVDLLHAEYEDVVAALRCGRAPSVRGEDGLVVLQLAQELIRAAQGAPQSEEAIPWIA